MQARGPAAGTRDPHPKDHGLLPGQGLRGGPAGLPDLQFPEPAGFRVQRPGPLRGASARLHRCGDTRLLGLEKIRSILRCRSTSKIYGRTQVLSQPIPIFKPMSKRNTASMSTRSILLKCGTSWVSSSTMDTTRWSRQNERSASAPTIRKPPSWMPLSITAFTKHNSAAQPPPSSEAAVFICSTNWGWSIFYDVV